jgi:hypothetical protein
VVLRSVGKFFGLAGARAGFTLAEPRLLQALAAELGPWALSGPARVVVRSALQDGAWQAAMRLQLGAAGQRLLALLQHHGLDARGTALFAWAPHAAAARLQDRLARAAIWVRRFDAPGSTETGAETGAGAGAGAGAGVDAGSGTVMPSRALSIAPPALPSIRFGLPGTPEQWARLEHALADCHELIHAGTTAVDVSHQGGGQRAAQP